MADVKQCFLGEKHISQPGLVDEKQKQHLIAMLSPLHNWFVPDLMTLSTVEQTGNKNRGLLF
jgi:hypothetical protein